jgi:hypothetical protein
MLLRCEPDSEPVLLLTNMLQLLLGNCYHR